MDGYQQITIHALISGKVQGVFFRDATQKKARQFKLVGWVKNTTNGQVELVATGERDAIMNFTNWLWEGSEKSEVSNVQWEEVTLQNFTDFNVV